jgi:hypothetical protein
VTLIAMAARSAGQELEETLNGIPVRKDLDPLDLHAQLPASEQTSGDFGTDPATWPSEAMAEDG